MRLLLKGKRRTCRHCKDNIYSFQARYKAVEGFYCVPDGKVKRLHDGVMKFIKGIVNARV